MKVDEMIWTAAQYDDGTWALRGIERATNRTLVAVRCLQWRSVVSTVRYWVRS